MTADTDHPLTRPPHRPHTPNTSPPDYDTFLRQPNATVRDWLSITHPKALTVLDRYSLDLHLGRLYSPTSGPSNTTDRRLLTSRTVELLRAIVGNAKWKHPAQLMDLLRAIGEELLGGRRGGGTGRRSKEPAIGNVVRRIMCALRVEVENAEVNQGQGGAVDGEPDLVVASSGAGALADGDGMQPIDENIAAGGAAATASGRSGLSLTSMLWAHPQHFATVDHNHRSGSSSSNTGSGGGGTSAATTKRLRSESFSSVDSAGRYSVGQGGDALKQPYPPSFYEVRPHFRQTVMEAIHEMIMEHEDVYKNINREALSYIHAGEIILTYGRSRTVEYFLKSAAKKRHFQVIVCEGAPDFGGHSMAKSLAEAGIDTTVVHDAATFAIMARANKVLLPAHAVLANGGLIAPSGMHMVALAASQNSVPLVVLTGMFKLCPIFPHEGQDTLQDLVSPSSFVHYADISSVGGGGGEIEETAMIDKVEFVNPVHDYIPPELIRLYVTNIGAFQPSYIYRLLAEYYHKDDYDTFE